MATKTPKDVLADIKKLAVRVESNMVALVTLQNMHQDRDEPIRNFRAKRISRQAGVCKFTIKCPNCEHDVNYTHTIIRDVLARGIAEADI